MVLSNKNIIPELMHPESPAVVMPYPEVNPGWVSQTTEVPRVPVVENTAYAQPPTQPVFETEVVVSTETTIAEDELQCLKRLGYSYQVLATSITRAKQAQQELHSKLAIYKTAIEERQQELRQVLVQLAEHQASPSAVPANEAEVTEEFTQLKELLKGSHHESLLNKLNRMQVALESDRPHLPELLTALRSELDLVSLQALRLSALEKLNEAYKKYRQFQEYNSRSDQEFQSLVRALTQG